MEVWLGVCFLMEGVLEAVTTAAREYVGDGLRGGDREAVEGGGVVMVVVRGVRVGG
jgi:hypothetical protein